MYHLWLFFFYNLFVFLLMGIDKYKAVYKKYRISEKILLLLFLFGGGIGGLSGMIMFHHKIRKWYFYLCASIGVCTVFLL
ncbi:DUF1294 domain-containing protein [Granulicatella sp. zg-ZJ]|uniref:DUF1294 domain-containing protein n=1 Tax=Granulicatella sp. zg-ZJ TaxID=2678504 RepID=UPI0013D74279|nr:DUF1294 domain-containing protein [Granulicatella sp. zg-ZJ]NEW61766.1 DUF1294 domain-containing protein [Granulicatella sp. zg-ZJ]